MCYVWYLLIPTKRALLSLASPIHMQQLQTAGQCNAYNIATHLHVKHFYACFSLFASPFAASSRRYMRSYVSFMNNTLTQRLCLTCFVNNKRGKKKTATTAGSRQRYSVELCSVVFFIAFLSAVIIWHLPKHINKPLEPLHTLWLYNCALWFLCIWFSCAAVVRMCWPSRVIVLKPRFDSYILWNRYMWTVLSNHSGTQEKKVMLCRRWFHHRL